MGGGGDEQTVGNRLWDEPRVHARAQWSEVSPRVAMGTQEPSEDRVCPDTQYAYLTRTNERANVQWAECEDPITHANTYEKMKLRGDGRHRTREWALAPPHAELCV
jgi:hypothetical protein